MSDQRQWGRTDDAGRWPWRGPLYTLRLVLLAVAVGGGLGWYQYRQLTPLQQAYLRDYIWSSTAAATIAAYCPHTPKCTEATYTVLLAVDGPQKRFATADVLVRPRADGRLVPIEWQERRYTHATLRDQLQEFIFERQTLWDLAWRPVAAGLLVALIGLFWAVPNDLRRWRERREGIHLGGPRLVSNAEFNRRLKGDGYGFEMGRGVKRGRR
jgi:hypothetical protein